MDALVSTDWLAANRNTPAVVILDASKHLPDAGRNALGDFEDAHIPGARFLDMPNLHDASAPVTNTMPSPAQISERMSVLGINSSDTIILYDDSAIKSASRAWFILKESGFHNVAILDGGLAKWRAENRPLESGSVNQAPTAALSLREPGKVRSKEDMLANITSKAAQVVDARDAGRFGGIEAEGGHIPSSRNLWFGALFAADGTYKPAGEIKALFAGAGIDTSKPVITTCNSGMTAAVLLFALHLIGRGDTALYDGSWSEWGADPETPKSIGQHAGEDA